MFVIKETNTNYITKTNDIKDVSEILINIFDMSNSDLVKIEKRCGNMTFGDVYKHDRFEIKCVKK